MFLKSVISSIIFFSASLVLAQSKAPVTLDGDYRLELTIKGKVFVDHLTLKGKNGPIELTDFNGGIIGTMEVPGMFTSPLRGGRGNCNTWNLTCGFYFWIEANENGQTYKVNYTAQMSRKNYQEVERGEGPAVLTGKATFKDGSVLGTFTATKQ
ncbi:hypothetical protein [Bdellovibrio sp. HCB337]|uniref:hypothetical protein n=1 Tax=Bdellovibrio sp. HCB337 TaxID=3394358 RepID=UPI0039A45E2D